MGTQMPPCPQLGASTASARPAQLKLPCREPKGHSRPSLLVMQTGGGMCNLTHMGPQRVQGSRARVAGSSREQAMGGWATLCPHPHLQGLGGHSRRGGQLGVRRLSPAPCSPCMRILRASTALLQLEGAVAQC